MTLDETREAKRKQLERLLAGTTRGDPTGCAVARTCYGRPELRCPWTHLCEREDRGTYGAACLGWRGKR